MATSSPERSPYSGEEEAEIIANFVNSDGEIIARQSATNLPIPSVGETISFGKLHAPDADSLVSEESEYTFGSNVYDVVDIEYTYSDIEIEEEDDLPVSEFVLVNIFIERLPDPTEESE